MDTSPNTPRFDVSTGTGADQFSQYLEEYGYAVAASVVPDVVQIESLKSSMWDMIEQGSNTVSRTDSSTWNAPAWPGHASTGIIGNSGHSDFMCRVRRLPEVKRAFSVIWNTDELITSLNVCNTFRSYTVNPLLLTDGGWWHVDQNAVLPKKSGRVCVQGEKRRGAARSGEEEH